MRVYSFFVVFFSKYWLEGCIRRHYDKRRRDLNEEIRGREGEGEGERRGREGEKDAIFCIRLSFFLYYQYGTRNIILTLDFRYLIQLLFTM